MSCTLTMDWPATRSRIVRLARASGAPAAIVEDVAQEVSIKVWSRLATFDPHKGPFDAWLRGITVNEVRNQLRHLRAVRRLAAASARRDAVDPRPALDAALTLESLAARLTAREGAALHATEILGYGSEEAAPCLGVRPATVRSLKRNALVRLYDMASEHASQPPGIDALRTCSRLVR